MIFCIYSTLNKDFHSFIHSGTWSFGNDYARNVVDLGVDNSSLSIADNCKNNFFVLGGRDTFGINGSFGALEKKFSISFTETKAKHFLSLHYNGSDYCFLLMEKKSLKKFQ